jgi:hypothetical protein
MIVEIYLHMLHPVTECVPEIIILNYLEYEKKINALNNAMMANMVI